MSQTAALKQKHDLDDVKMVLITNASMFHREVVQRGLEVLDQNNGEIWAKLDAGTEEYYQLIDRSKIRYSQILENITSIAIKRPIVIQSLFMHVNGEPPTAQEIDAYCERLNEVCHTGGVIKLVQVYTIARQTTEDYVTPLSDLQVDQIAKTVVDKTGLKTEVFYGK